MAETVKAPNANPDRMEFIAEEIQSCFDGVEKVLKKVTKEINSLNGVMNSLLAESFTYDEIDREVQLENTEVDKKGFKNVSGGLKSVNDSIINLTKLIADDISYRKSFDIEGEDEGRRIPIMEKLAGAKDSFDRTTEGGLGSIFERALGAAAIGGLVYLFRDELGDLFTTIISRTFEELGQELGVNSEFSSRLASSISESLPEVLVASLVGYGVLGTKGAIAGALGAYVFSLSDNIASYIKDNSLPDSYGDLAQLGIDVAGGATLGAAFGPGGALIGAILGFAYNASKTISDWLDTKSKTEADALRKKFEALGMADYDVQIYDKELNRKRGIENSVGYINDEMYNSRVSNPELSDLLSDAQDLSKVAPSQLSDLGIIDQKIKETRSTINNLDRVKDEYDTSLTDVQKQQLDSLVGKNSDGTGNDLLGLLNSFEKLRLALTPDSEKPMFTKGVVGEFLGNFDEDKEYAFYQYKDNRTADLSLEDLLTQKFHYHDMQESVGVALPPVYGEEPSSDGFRFYEPIRNVDVGGLLTTESVDRETKQLGWKNLQPLNISSPINTTQINQDNSTRNSFHIPLLPSPTRSLPSRDPRK